MKRIRIFFFALFCSAASLWAQPLEYPKAQKLDHVDSYFGTPVADPYRWMESDTSKSVAAWVEAENKVTFGYLGKIPFREHIKERLTKIWNYPKYTAPFREGENYYFYKNDGLQNQSVLYIRHGLEAAPEILLDPNNLSADGTVALGGLGFSKDGKYLAYGISRSGSDWREIYVIEVGSKTQLPDKIKWAKFTGISWFRNGFFYSRYDAPADTTKALTAKNEYQKVYYHEVGSEQSSDRLVYEDQAHPLRTFGLSVTEDERYGVLMIDQGGSTGNAVYFRQMSGGDTSFRPVIETFDDNFSLVGVIDRGIVLRTDRKAPNGRVILVDPSAPGERDWKDVLPEQKDALMSASLVGGKLVATYMKDVSHHVYVYDTGGRVENEITLPALGAVTGFSGKKDDQIVFYSATSFTFPPTIYQYDFRTKESKLYQKPKIDFDPDSYETRQVFYKSKDGTRIPMFIVHKKGLVLDGKNPALLYGYGGFNINLTPQFSASRLLWLESGGVFAQANLRGGGEYGEEWHRGGMGLNKQHVFDDFIAAAEYLIAGKYTSPQSLAIQGASNGGLLIGAVINQRPDLFRVALPAVGVMDMLRFQKFTIGWAWVPDYGSSDDSVNFRNLYSFSPLHNIHEGVRYPAVLVSTADHDDRVVPAHSFKYIATLQEKYHGNNPVLIRIETKAGHGGGKPTSKIIEETADIYAFTFYNMGLTPR
ncbi:MAG TPA: prolyl oligopeptidase family serine peptidase [Bacteroidota bacterium]|nr:prolyl oligopeptidase family serine peptidase [Bacteroidota bacterium]